MFPLFSVKSSSDSHTCPVTLQIIVFIIAAIVFLLQKLIVADLWYFSCHRSICYIHLILLPSVYFNLEKNTNMFLMPGILLWWKKLMAYLITLLLLSAYLDITVNVWESSSPEEKEVRSSTGDKYVMIITRFVFSIHSLPMTHLPLGYDYWNKIISLTCFEWEL